MNLEGFERWLRKLDPPFSEASIRKVVGDVRRLKQNGGPTQTKSLARVDDYRWAWDLYEEYRQETGASSLRVPRPPELSDAQSKRKKRARSKRAESQEKPIEPKSFRLLLSAIEQDEHPAARVLETMAATGYRVGDVLRIRGSELDAGFSREDGLTDITVKGGKRIPISVLGVPEVWEGLREIIPNKRFNVAEALTGVEGASTLAGDAAYKQVSRRLSLLGEAVGIDERLHTHRFRHTAANMADAAGVDRAIVSKMLGHESLKTTERHYLRSAQARAVAEAHAQMYQAVRKGK